MASEETSTVISPFDLLPDEIWLRIFTELPVTTICLCRVVNSFLTFLLNGHSHDYYKTKSFFFLFRYLKNGIIYYKMKHYGSIIVHCYLNQDHLYHQKPVQH